MALTDTQKAEIIFFIGWPGKTLVENSTSFNRIVSDRLNNLTAEIEAQITKIIGRVKKIDDKLMEAVDRFSTKKVGDIEINDKERSLLKGERKRYITQISQLVDIEMQASGGINFGVVV